MKTIRTLILTLIAGAALSTAAFAANPHNQGHPTSRGDCSVAQTSNSGC